MSTIAATLFADRRDLTTRLFGSMWFLLLAVMMVNGALSNLLSMQAVARISLGVFYLLLWWLILSRPPAVSQARGLLPRIAAFTGTYMPWCISFTTRSQIPTLDMLSTILVVGGILLTIITVSHLGRSFSLVPQARRLVQDGPYRYIRHPLYLAEEIAIIGAALQFLSLTTVLILLLHVGIQLLRIWYEEKLLGETLPEYSHYAASRWRVIPFVW